MDENHDKSANQNIFYGCPSRIPHRRCQNAFQSRPLPNSWNFTLFWNQGNPDGRSKIMTKMPVRLLPTSTKLKFWIRVYRSVFLYECLNSNLPPFPWWSIMPATRVQVGMKKGSWSPWILHRFSFAESLSASWKYSSREAAWVFWPYGQASPQAVWLGSSSLLYP